jgi:Tat protein secretion system quality control protein TatD with DNase activity
MHFGGWYLKSKFLRKDPNKYQPGTTGDANVVIRYRNEPCMIVQIIEIVAHLRRVQVANIINACNKNTFNLFRYEMKTRQLETYFYDGLN